MTFLTKFEPFDELTTLKNRLDRVMNRFTPAFEEEIFTTQWAPPADVLETKEALLIKVELPGFTEKDIKVEIENGVLSISGERKLEKKDEEKNYYRIERSYGKFIRSFTLPANLYGEKILATVNNGLLEVEIPKKESAKPRTVNVEVKKKLPVAA